MHTASPEPNILLTCKLHVPHRGRQLVSRDSLIDALGAGRAHKVTLVDAPAGSGKTTLLAQWAVEEQGHARFAWLSLETSDNDPVRFWTYVVATLQQAEPDLAGEASRLLQARADLTEVILPTLLNELTGVEGDLVLVLDDYHLIGARVVHEQMAFFIDHMPPTLRLVLATRSDPPLPLARLRARGNLLEIRASELRFPEAEADQLLNGIISLDLATEQVSFLCERTEGWAAGLYLAALSLAGRRDAAGFISGFAGYNRHIVDYLSAEVLDGQPVRLRTFLLRTSVLERLSVPLCDAVLQTSDSATVLEQIERANLFLVPLDSSRRAYRYHHLFGDLLRSELARTEPDLVPELHQRAARWFRDEGLLDNAIRHLVAGCDFEGAAEFIAAKWGAEFNRGRLATVSSWLDLLPERMVTEDARLCLARAWLALDLRRLAAAGMWIARAEAAAAARGADGESMPARMAHVRALHRLKLGDVATAVDLAGLAISLDVGDFSPGRPAAYCVYGAALFWSGDEAGARAALGRAAELADEVDNQAARTYALGYLAVMAVQRGRSSEAEGLIRDATGGDRDAAVGEHFVDMMTSLATDKVLIQRGEVELADRAAHRAVVLAQRGGGHLEVVNALVARSEVLRWLGDPKSAQDCTDEARSILEGCPDPGVARELIAAAPRRTGVDPLPGSAEPSPAEQLTSKELEVLRLLSTQLSRREIAAHLYVSINTVKTHQRAVFRKLAVTDRAGAAARARALGIL